MCQASEPEIVTEAKYLQELLAANPEVEESIRALLKLSPRATEAIRLCAISSILQLPARR
jgi:hypothetical protein